MKTCHLIIGLLSLALAACNQTKNDEPAILPGGAADPAAARPEQPRPSQPIRPLAASSETAQAEPKPFVPSAPGKRVARVSVPGNYVALTFDDGPSAALTPQVLDILARHGAHGTFFVLGENAARNASILSRAAAEGHEVGNHTYSHIKMTGSSQEKIRREIERTNSIIESATGRCPRVMRPPYGATNSGIVGSMFHDYGLTSVLWDVDTRDWQHPGKDAVVRRAVGGARPGSIILVHDIHASTLAALEDIVIGLQARGFKLVTVSQLIGLGKRAAGEQAASPQQAAGAAPAPAAQGTQGALGMQGTQGAPLRHDRAGNGTASIGVPPAQKPEAAAPAASGSSSLSVPVEY